MTDSKSVNQIEPVNNTVNNLEGSNDVKVELDKPTNLLVGSFLQDLIQRLASNSSNTGGCENVGETGSQIKLFLHDLIEQLEVKALSPVCEDQNKSKTFSKGLSKKQSSRVIGQNPTKLCEIMAEVAVFIQNLINSVDKADGIQSVSKEEPLKLRNQRSLPKFKAGRPQSNIEFNLEETVSLADYLSIDINSNTNKDMDSINTPTEAKYPVISEENQKKKQPTNKSKKDKPSFEIYCPKASPKNIRQSVIFIREPGSFNKALNDNKLKIMSELCVGNDNSDVSNIEKMFDIIKDVKSRIGLRMLYKIIIDDNRMCSIEDLAYTIEKMGFSHDGFEKADAIKIALKHPKIDENLFTNISTAFKKIASGLGTTDHGMIDMANFKHICMETGENKLNKRQFEQFSEISALDQNSSVDSKLFKHIIHDLSTYKGYKNDS